MLLSGADIIVKTLVEQGVKVIFGYPGGQIINVYDSLYKYQDEIEHVLTAHEQGAVHAADGYARSTGKPGVVFATSGPGATNLVTGIATAFLDSVPLIAITGNVPTTQIGYDSFQEIDITGITLPITKHNYFVSDVANLADTIRDAIELATSGRPGPVLIDVPKDVQISLWEYRPQPPVKPAEPQPAKDLRIAQAAEVINDSERPFISFGGGMLSSGAQEEVLALADKIDSPIGCSMMGISGVPTEHPRFLGMQGMHGHYACSTAMHNADCIIALGVRFNDRSTGNRHKFATKSRIVHIDIDGSELSKTTSDSVGLRGDVKKTLEKLLPLIKSVSHPEWREKIARLRALERGHEDQREGLTPKNAIRTLNKYLGENTPVATDVGQHQMWAAQELVFKKSRRFISSGGLGTMGFGMGAAIGSAYGTGEKTVLITGDGSFGMCLNELATAVTYNVPLVILLMNNGVLGMVRQWQTLFYGKRYSQTVLNDKVDYIKLSEALGVKAIRVTKKEEVEGAIKEALSTKGPVVIEVVIESDDKVFPMVAPGKNLEDCFDEKDLQKQQ